MGFRDINGFPNIGQTTRPNNSHQKNFQNCRFWCPGRPQCKTETTEKKDMYQNLARDLKKLWNIKVTVIAIEIGNYATVTDWRTWK